ncbi:MAG: trypsin-like peptidase domain-containing protein [Sedimentisphaerales bacterium]|nr:trypsin-like peptidase domain-containing protein [Sedimentisphaerales bacterium]
MQPGDKQHSSIIGPPGGWTLAGVLIMGLMVLGILSLRQHQQIQELRKHNQYESLQHSQYTDTMVYQLVDLQHRIKNQLDQSNQRINEIVKNIEQSEEILPQLSDGVCLIQGEYTFVDPETDLPLRYPLLGQEDDEAFRSDYGILAAVEYEMEEDIGTVPLSVKGAGPPLVVQYTGTGFLIDSDGYIVTNHHVTAPWVVSNEHEHILEAGYEPQFLLFRAFFPNQSEPFDLEVTAVSKDEDVAILYSPMATMNIPALECSMSPESLKTGQTVMILGYPTGFDLLLARLKQDDLEELIPDGGTTFDDIAINMSQRHLIQPIATRGMCGRVSDGRIVYDAPTAIGASGAPVIGSNGKVLALNTALMKGFDGTNFGIPIQYALELLGQIKSHNNTENEPDYLHKFSSESR